MKKTLARFLSIMLVLALLAAGAAVAPASAEAAAIPEEFDLFIAYGGDKEAENDWGWQRLSAALAPWTSPLPAKLTARMFPWT